MVSCAKPGCEQHLGERCISELGRRCGFFDICLNENMLKMLMCCIIDIQPNDLPEFLSATLHYTNHFTDCQTNNTKYFKFFHNHHNLFISTVLK